jgi:hypothetical protein
MYFIILHKFCYQWILYLTICVILQDGSGSAEDQPRAAEHPSCSGVDLSGHDTKFAEDPFDSSEMLRKRWTRKSHYVAPPLVPTNPESRSIIKPVSER